MIKAIIFDFDGVIIESAEIKTRAFELLFAGYPDKVKEIIAYHKKNMGGSLAWIIPFFATVLCMVLGRTRETAFIGIQNKQLRIKKLFVLERVMKQGNMFM
ncbi:hypothetical protein HX99_01395 [Peptococcaceae bacterium SCADC1_2_3]|nr:hypothetical protein HX99_01395 [Peptococcaceae bacterium SCADC1_2_3]